MENFKKNGLLLRGLSVSDYFKIISIFFNKGCLVVDDLNLITGWNDYWNDVYKGSKIFYKSITSSFDHPPHCDPIFDIEEIKLSGISIYKITPVNDSAIWEIAGLMCSGDGYLFILIEEFSDNEKIKNLIDFYFKEIIDEKSFHTIDNLVKHSNFLIFSVLLNLEEIERTAYIEDSSKRRRFTEIMGKSLNRFKQIEDF